MCVTLASNLRKNSRTKLMYFVKKLNKIHLLCLTFYFLFIFETGARREYVLPSTNDLHYKTYEPKICLSKLECWAEILQLRYKL